MAIIKRCELCLKYTDCSLYDKVCENLEFLKNFLDIIQSNQIAQYCKGYKAGKKEKPSIQLLEMKTRDKKL